MPKQGLTYLGLILDRSGSMARIRTDMEGALNTFINDQKKVPGECLVTLVQFDDVVETYFEHRDIKDVGQIELLPRNMTALLDAMGTTINRLGQHFVDLSEDERPEKVLIVTITDGLENSSHEFTHSQIKSLVEEQQSKWNWSFTYLGANQDAVLVGTNLGYERGSTMSYASTGASTRAAGQSLSSATTRFRGAVADASFGYNATERADVAKTVNPRSQSKSTKARLAALSGTPEEEN